MYESSFAKHYWDLTAIYINCNTYICIKIYDTVNLDVSRRLLLKSDRGHSSLAQFQGRSMIFNPRWQSALIISHIHLQRESSTSSDQARDSVDQMCHCARVASSLVEGGTYPGHRISRPTDEQGRGMKGTRSRGCADMVEQTREHPLSPSAPASSPSSSRVREPREREPLSQRPTTASIVAGLGRSLSSVSTIKWT